MKSVGGSHEAVKFGIFINRSKSLALLVKISERVNKIIFRGREKHWGSYEAMKFRIFINHPKSKALLVKNIC